MESILTSIKKILGIDEDYVQFDPEIIMFINSVFMNLCQLGVGPKTIFSIESKDDLWSDFFGVDLIDYESAKIYMGMKVRLLFDPPTSSSLIDAFERQLSEVEWRLTTQASNDQYTSDEEAVLLLEEES